MDPQHERPRADSFAVAGVWTLVATLVPGLGLIRTGRRKRGMLAIGLVVGTLAALAVIAAVRREWALAMLVDPTFLRVGGAVLAVVGLLWVLVIATTYRSLRPTPVQTWQRVTGFVLVTLLSFAVAAPTAVGARYAWSQADLVRSVFGGNTSARAGSVPQEWKDKGTLNVLLLGGDSGADRTGLRTDTVMVASIDTRTGDTVLFGLPRNTARMPFPAGPLRKAYPNGWYDGVNADNPDYFLNSMYEFVPQQHPELFPDAQHAGGDVMKASVGEALGIKIDYFAVVNLAGFERLINALGGVTVNINSYIPMGGQTDAHILPTKWLSPGPNQHLNGNQALWYARGRFGSDDFQRMNRQRCVMNALADQANVSTLLGRYEAIAREFQSVVLTDVPQDDLPSVLDLALMMRQGNMRSIVFTNGVAGFRSAHPDFALMRTRVQQAIEESHQTATAKPTQAPTTTATTTAGKAASAPAQQPTRAAATAPATPSATPTTTSENVRDACAYDPVAAQQAKDNPPYWVK
ncbi:cell envelope-related function transcriptional attenuator common domain-containing protein [Raineyella antarctica]|uniref:Cell envelope-related function transcriptional attenuator common domain-containing protein n=1 Tax=Raineyella antarctica TaxID=1577474 RepID=A0A1G6GG06_9ACTN|nr:LCP family protein [Raineyella antarctica]SDB80890.1 cell envelope-related function transcriptional attenuator common domain-containing protein [Raineyella antarctica]